MTTTNKIFLQLLERDIRSELQGKWISWTIVTRVIAYYSTYCFLLLHRIALGWVGSGTGLEPFNNNYFNNILSLLKKCKECNSKLKQIGSSNRYFCDSSPTVCNQSGKTHNI